MPKIMMNMQQQFLVVVQNNDTKILEEYVCDLRERDPDLLANCLNQTTPSGLGLLHEALFHAQNDVAKHLVSIPELDINKQVYFEKWYDRWSLHHVTALFIATHRDDDCQMVTAFLERADLIINPLAYSVDPKESFTPLVEAARESNTPVLIMLARFYIDHHIERNSKENYIPLIEGAFTQVQKEDSLDSLSAAFGLPLIFSKNEQKFSNLAVPALMGLNSLRQGGGIQSIISEVSDFLPGLAEGIKSAILRNSQARG